MPELLCDHADGRIVLQSNADEMDSLAEEMQLSSLLGYVNEAG